MARCIGAQGKGVLLVARQVILAASGLLTAPHLIQELHEHKIPCWWHRASKKQRTAVDAGAACYVLHKPIPEPRACCSCGRS